MASLDESKKPQASNMPPSRPSMRGRGGPMMGGPGVGFGGVGGKAKNFKESMKRLLNVLTPYAVMFTVAILFSAAATVLSILAPSYLGRMTDEIRVYSMGVDINMSVVFSIGITLAVFYVLSTALSYTQAFIMAGINQKVSKRLRQDISQKINRVPFKYYDRVSTGDILSRVTNDVDTIGQTLNQNISTLITSVTMLIGVIIAMTISCWQLFLTAVVTIPLSVIIMTLIMKISQKYFVAQQRNLGELNGQIEETYSGLNVVKAFNGEKKSLKTFSKTNQRLHTCAVKAQFLSGLMMPIMHLISNIGLIAVCVVGGLLVSKQIISLGIVVSFFVYIRQFQNPLSNIAQAAGNLQSTAAASERVFEFLDEEEVRENGEIVPKPDSIKGAVEFRGVRFGYTESNPVIKDFSLNVLPGQKIAIVGHTGAGKTTLINLLMRFYDIQSGEILIDGIPISSMKREDVRSMFGMVLQDTWLFEGTIKENIVYSKQGTTDEEIEAACKAANIHHFIKTLPEGYDMKLSDEVNISGGQKQLLTIARAILQNSPMMILDEATSNVDTRTEQLIQNAMDNITKGRTSFVIAHRLSTIKNADVILVLKDGDIVEKGAHQELLEKGGFYAELYNSQFNPDSLITI